jgi:hypothetical protein
VVELVVVVVVVVVLVVRRFSTAPSPEATGVGLVPVAPSAFFGFVCVVVMVVNMVGDYGYASLLFFGKRRIPLSLRDQWQRPHPNVKWPCVIACEHMCVFVLMLESRSVHVNTHA